MDIKENNNLATNITRHFWEIARLKIIQRIITDKIDTPQSVIDIGCGDCFVLQSLSQQYPNTHFIGIDTALTDKMIDDINKSTDNKKISIHRKLHTNQINKADLVLMLDVLEHIEDEENFLRSLHKIMHQDTKIIITVPAFQKLFTYHDQYLKHFRRYNRKQLVNMLEKSEFKVTISGYFFCSLIPFRIIEKLRHVKTSPEKNLHVANKFINNLLTIFLYVDATISYMLSNKKIYIPGLSCFAIAKLKSNN